MNKTEWYKKLKKRDQFSRNKRIRIYLQDGFAIGLMGSVLLYIYISSVFSIPILTTIISFGMGGWWVWMSNGLIKVGHDALKSSTCNYEVDVLGIRKESDRFKEDLVIQ